MTQHDIFYVDDDLEDLDLFAEAVNELSEKQKTEISLTVLNSGNELINSLISTTPDNPIVLLDINMPVKNGFEVLREIRENERLKKVPVLMYSTSRDVKSVNLSFDLGADLYIIKPSDMKELKSIITKLISIEWKNPKNDFRDFVLNP